MKYCPNCGNQLKDNARFCGKCGNAVRELKHLETPVIEETEKPVIKPVKQKKQKKKNRHLPFVLAMVVTSILVLGYFFFLRGIIQYYRSEKTIDLYLGKSQFLSEESTYDVFVRAEINFVDAEEMIVCDQFGKTRGVLTAEDDRKNKNTNVYSGTVTIDLTKAGTIELYAFCRNGKDSYCSEKKKIVIVNEYPEQYYASEDATDEILETELNEKVFTLSGSFNRKKAVLEILENLSANNPKKGEGYVSADSIEYDEELNQVYFRDAAGTLCVIELDDPEPETNSTVHQEENTDTDLSTVILNTFFSKKVSGDILVMYGLEDTDVSNVKDYDEIIELINKTSGIHMMIENGTVDNFRTMLIGKKMVVIECHGKVLKVNGTKMPVYQAMGKRNKYPDTDELRFDRQHDYVLKNLSSEWNYNSNYLITPMFIDYYYGKDNKLDNTIVHLGNCEGFGNNVNDLNFRLAASFANAGAPGIVGFVNSVYTKYDKVFMIHEVAYLVSGFSLSESFELAKKGTAQNDNEYMKDKVDKLKRKAAYPEMFGDGSFINSDMTISPESYLYVYGRYGELAANYTLKISKLDLKNNTYGVKDTATFKTESTDTIQVNASEPYKLNLEEGIYKINISKNKDYSEYEYVLTVKPDNDTEFSVYTDFIDETEKKPEYLDEVTVITQESDDPEKNFTDKIGANKNTAGNTDYEGNQYNHGIEVCLNSGKKSSVTTSYFLAKRYNYISGKVVYPNTTYKDQTDCQVEFYGDNVLIDTIIIKPDQQPDIFIKVSDVSVLEIKVINNSDNASAIFHMVEMKFVNNIPKDAIEINTHYYEFYRLPEISTWESAEEYCRSVGGHLAVISSEEENNALFALMVERGYKNAYFGYTDRENEGNWHWIDGYTSDYVNWASIEPNSDNSHEDYAMFYWKYPDGKWNDGDFGRNTVNGDTVFICEWDY